MSDLSVGRVSLVEGPLTSEGMNPSRRTVLASFAALAVFPGPVGSAVAATWPGIVRRISVETGRVVS
jgi:hypothetical protein